MEQDLPILLRVSSSRNPVMILLNLKITKMFFKKHARGQRCSAKYVYDQIETCFDIEKAKPNFVVPKRTFAHKK